MELINFLGLNCYHNCIVTIAHHLGYDYSCAFCNLWSETEFRYEEYRKVFLSQRLIENLSQMGLRLDMRLCFSPEEAEISFAATDDGAPVIVGMDAFYIPWNPFFGVFHGPHYFIAEKNNTGELFCVDPTYDRQSERISQESICAHAFDISHMRAVEKGAHETGITAEAERILRTHDDTREELLLRVENCVHERKSEVLLLAKHVDAMISNRYLFKHYLGEKQRLSDERKAMFDRELFKGWTAVKNGLYKASIKEARQSILGEVERCLNQVIDKELAIAEELLGG